MNPKDSLSPITSRRNVLSDHVYEALCGHIIAGKFKPGERLREAQVAEALGVSRTPVREAFARLEHQNLLRKEISGAYFVVEWDEKTLQEVATLRAALEGLAIQLACQNLSPADFLRMEDLTQQMEIARQNADKDRLIALDIDFHSSFWAHCDHSLLQQALEDMKAQILYFMYNTRPGDEEDYPEMHRKMTEALKSGDPLKANAILQEHLLSTAGRAIIRLKQNQNLQE